MKISKTIKALLVAVAAVFILAAPGYSWTHEDNFPGVHRDHHARVEQIRHYDRHQRGWGYWAPPVYTGAPAPQPYVYDPYVPAYPAGPGFSIYLPGFALHVGP